MRTATAPERISNHPSFMKAAIVVLAAFIMAPEARADLIGIQLPYNQFGHLVNVGPLCAPTSVANSFQFLVNRYPRVYRGTDLIRLDLESTRNQLAGGWVTSAGQFRQGMAPQGGSNPTCGAAPQPWWETKVQWVTDFAAGTTVFDGMVKADASTWLGGAALKNALPTWDFLWRELKDGEDVEIGFEFGGAGTVFPPEAHAVTLTSLKFDDQNGNGKFDGGEPRRIDYLDPNNPTRLFESALTDRADGSLGFLWNNETGNPVRDVSIYLAYSESPVNPVPESPMLLLFGGGLLCTLLFHRRRVKTRDMTKFRICRIPRWCQDRTVACRRQAAGGVPKLRLKARWNAAGES